MIHATDLATRRVPRNWCQTNWSVNYLVSSQLKNIIISVTNLDKRYLYIQEIKKLKLDLAFIAPKHWSEQIWTNKVIIQNMTHDHTHDEQLEELERCIGIRPLNIKRITKDVPTTIYFRRLVFYTLNWRKKIRKLPGPFSALTESNPSDAQQKATNSCNARTAFVSVTQRAPATFYFYFTFIWLTNNWVHWYILWKNKKWTYGLVYQSITGKHNMHHKLVHGVLIDYN